MSGAIPERAADFVGALGVNIHLSQGAVTAKDVIADMGYLGLSHVRDHGPGQDTSSSVIAAFGQLAAAGIQMDWLVGGLPGVTVYRIRTFQHAYPHFVTAVEGPNEVNNFPITFRGLTGTAAAVYFQQVLYNLAHGTRPLGIPVINFTDSPMTAGLSDASNAHPYPKDGDQPLATLAGADAIAQAVQPGEPVWFTEAGYPTLPQPGQPQGVDDITQAKLTLNLIMDAANLGVVATYLYDLVDDGPDPSHSNVVDHFGLFTLAGTAKPSAVAIHDLTTILADSGPNATTFTPTPINVTFRGLPVDGASRVIETSSGVYDIVVWAEPTIWNTARGTPITAPTVAVTVNLGASFKQVQVFDPLVSASAISSTANASSVTLSLVDHPLIVQVSNLAAAMSALPAAPAHAASGPVLGAPPPHIQTPILLSQIP